MRHSNIPRLTAILLAMAVSSFTTSFAQGQEASKSPPRNPAVLVPDFTIATPQSLSGPVVNLDDADVRSSSHSDYELLKTAIQKVKKIHASLLLIPNRTYHIQAPRELPATAAIIDFSGFKDLVIDGNGAKFVFVDIQHSAAVRLAHDERIVLKNLTIDWAPIQAYPGVLSRVTNPESNQQSTLLIIDNNYPINPSSAPSFTGLMQFDTAKREYHETTKPNYAHFFPNAEKGISHRPRHLNGQTFLLPKDDRLNLIGEGSQVLATLRDNVVHAIEITRGSSDITLEHVNVYSSPGSGIVAINAGRGLHLNHCKVTRKPDAELDKGEQPRLISTLSDAIDVIATEGNTLIEDCEISHEADDGINIRGLVRRFDSLAGDARSIRVRESNPDAFKINDPLSFYSSDQFEWLGSTRIESAHFAAGTDSIRLADPFPASIPADQMLVGNDRISSRNFILRNNHFHHNKNRGILIRGGVGLVESNVVEYTSASGIQLGSENTSFLEGPPVNHVTVRNNRISHTNRSDSLDRADPTKFPAALMVYAAVGKQIIKAPIHQNIVIEGNTFSNVPGMAMLVASTKNSYITNNKIVQSNQASYGNRLIDRVSIRIYGSTAVHSSGNQFELPTTVRHIVSDNR